MLIIDPVLSIYKSPSINGFLKFSCKFLFQNNLPSGIIFNFKSRLNKKHWGYRVNEPLPRTQQPPPWGSWLPYALSASGLLPSQPTGYFPPRIRNPMVCQCSRIFTLSILVLMQGWWSASCWNWELYLYKNSYTLKL